MHMNYYDRINIQKYYNIGKIIKKFNYYDLYLFKLRKLSNISAFCFKRVLYT